MQRLLAIVLVVLLNGCAVIDTVKNQIPSFWDDNENRAIIDVRLSVERLDCAQAQHPQAQQIVDRIDWLRYYSESKRSRDIMRITEPMQKTAEDFAKRTQDKDASRPYCELKKKVLQEQVKATADSMLRRF